MAKTRNLMRILSVFVAVVIVSVTFMQPIAYANAAIIAGGALVLLIGSMLVAAGITFTSPSQAQAVTNHVLNNMPDDLLGALTGEGVLIGDIRVKLKPEIVSVMQYSRETWEKFKTWVYNFLGINAGKLTPDSSYTEMSLANQNIVGIIKTAVDADGTVLGLPVYSAEFLQKQWNEKIVAGSVYYSDTGPFGIDIIVGNYHIYPAGIAKKEESNDYNYERKTYIVGCENLLTGEKQQTSFIVPTYEKIKYLYVCKYLFGIQDGQLTFRLSWEERIKKSYVGGKWVDDRELSYVNGGIMLGSVIPSNDKVHFANNAYTHEMPEDAEHVSIGVPESFDGLPYPNGGWISTEWWKDYLTNHDGIDRYEKEEELPSVDVDWDAMKRSVDKMLDWLRDCLLNPAKREAIESYAGSDVITGVNELIAEREAIRDLVNAGAYDVLAGLGSVVDGVNGVLTGEAVNTGALEGTINGILDRVRAQNPAIEIEGIDWTPLANLNSFTGVFPFCIPFDIAAMVKSLSSTPQAPKFEIPFKYGGYIDEKIIIDMAVVNDIVPFVRLFILLDFVIALAWATSKVIKW